jgi:hypothetical protein
MNPQADLNKGRVEWVLVGQRLEDIHTQGAELTLKSLGKNQKPGETSVSMYDHQNESHNNYPAEGMVLPRWLIVDGRPCLVCHKLEIFTTPSFNSDP